MPSYVSARDMPWLRALLDEHARFTGRRRKELAERMREPLEPRAPKAKLDLARRVLETFDNQRPITTVPPKQVRKRLFVAASAMNAPRDAVIERVAAELGVTPEDLERCLFADLRGERRVAPLPPDLTPERLAIETNRALVAALLRGATSVGIRARGGTAELLRHVQRLGLICRLEAEHGQQGDQVALTVSGPFALFRHTEVYGRALASIVPRALSCDQFELEVGALLGRARELSTVLVRSGDPIGAYGEVAARESTAGERFAADFTRVAKRWHLLPNPRRCSEGAGALLASFELVHRDRPERWQLGLAGYWTREHVEASLSSLRRVAGERFILCIDERMQCGRDDVTDPRILRYRRRIDVGRLLALIEGQGSAA